MFCPNDGARLVKLKSRPDALLGRVFDDRYELRAMIGQGGMGTVYRGWQRSVDREVAIKVIHPKLSMVRAAAKRFLREARLSSRLSQPNIVNVHDFGQTEDGILYLVMELLRGHPLADDLRLRRPLPLRRIITITSQICDALESAHGQGIIHRDLKPQNILLLDDPPGRDLLKILDFGLAKSLASETTSLVTRTDAVLGTPLYMPPEHILGKPSDQRADLYSLGCLLYQMSCGRPPFRRDNINALLGAHIHDPPPPLPDTVPPRLAGTIQRLLRKEPEDRFATAGLVHDEMDALAAGSMDAAPEVAAPTAGSDRAPAAAAEPPPPRRSDSAAELLPPGRSDSAAELLSLRWSDSAAELPPPRSRRRYHAAGVAVLLAAGVAIALVVALQQTSPAPVSSPALAAAPDAAPAASPAVAPADSAPTAPTAPTVAAASAPTDAGPPVDAARPSAPRSASRPRPVRVDAGAPPPIEAGMPPLDLLPTSSAADHR